jgi:hypothetical protein
MNVRELVDSNSNQKVIKHQIQGYNLFIFEDISL